MYFLYDQRGYAQRSFPSVGRGYVDLSRCSTFMVFLEKLTI